VRKVCFEELGLKVDDYVDELGCSLGEELLRPTRIYTETVLNIIKNFPVRGLVHITGGGFIDNIPRILPKGCRAVIDRNSWPLLPIFDFLRQGGKISGTDMYRTFNCGIGMVMIVGSKDVEDVIMQLGALGEKAYVIGEISACQGKSCPAVEIDCA
jgi:phosphoribosylformylglycinamidine cyclo-ligase